MRRGSTARDRSARLDAAWLACLALAGCRAETPRATGGAATPATALDPAIARDTAALLGRLVEVPSTTGSGRTAEVAALLREHLSALRIDARVVPAGLGEASLVARLPAPRASAGPLLLVAHLDVHPAEPARWSPERGPWSGALDEGAVHGRGTLDGKGMAAIYAGTLASLRRGPPLPLDVVLLAAADGLAPHPRALDAMIPGEPDLHGATLAFTRGGATIVDLLGDGRPVHAVAVDELGRARLEVAAVAPARDAAAELAHALARILSSPRPPRLTPAVAELLSAASESAPFPRSLAMRSPGLARAFLLEGLAARPLTAPLVSERLQVTALLGGSPSDERAPARARAVLTASLLPGDTPGALAQRVRARAASTAIHVSVLDGEESLGTAPDPKTLAEVARALGGDAPGAPQVVPTLATESMGARALLGLGVRTYGFVPWTLTEADLATVRGAGERLERAELERAIARMTAIVREVAGSVHVRADLPRPRPVGAGPMPVDLPDP